MEEKIIIALEIGSSKIKGATGSVGPDGALNVKAVEEEPITDIVRYGCIRNIVETAQAVRNVISRLEQREAPRKVEGVYLSLGGRSLTAQSVEIERRLAAETIITHDIIEDITREALDYAMNERSIITATPRELLVDGKATRKPEGEMGAHIRARLNLISCRTQLLRNLSVVIEERLGLKIMDTFVRPLALADLVLLSDEKKLGCMLVDFGAETTTVAIFRGGVLIHLAVLPMGSRNITRDITTLNYLEEQAEELKRSGGSAFPTLEAAYSPVQPDFVAINNYVSARACEIIINICEQIKYAGFIPSKLPEGIVIVGKGARLKGFNQRLEQLSGMKVRAGVPGNRLRILDGRIQVADSVDVLSILNMAAKSNPRECMSPLPAAAPQPDNAQHQAQSDHAVSGAGSYTPPASSMTPSHTPEQQSGATTTTGPRVPGQAPKPVSPTPPSSPVSGESGPGKGGTGGKSNPFVRGYNALVAKVANIITDTFEEEEDEE